MSTNEVVERLGCLPTFYDNEREQFLGITLELRDAIIEALSTRPLQVPTPEDIDWLRGLLAKLPPQLPETYQRIDAILSMQKAAPAAPSEPWQPSEAQIKAMANRFLCWPLPEHFTPDAGISFKPEFNVEHMAARGKPPMRHKPVGTNLFNAEQAEVMVRFMVEALVPPQKASNQ